MQCDSLTSNRNCDGLANLEQAETLFGGHDTAGSAVLGLFPFSSFDLCLLLRHGQAVSSCFVEVRSRTKGLLDTIDFRDPIDQGHAHILSVLATLGLNSCSGPLNIALKAPCLELLIGLYELQCYYSFLGWSKHGEHANLSLVPQSYATCHAPSHLNPVAKGGAGGCMT